MEQQPVMFRSGKRVYLSPLQKEDVPTLYRWINNPNLHKFLTVDMPMSLEDEYAWYENLLKRKGEDVVFAIRLMEDHSLLGLIGLHKIKFKDGGATLGYYIGREELHGKGYGTESLMIVLEYAFNTLNLHRVSAEVYDFNQKSMRCLTNCGFIREGTVREGRFRVGRRVDCHIFGILRSEFIATWNVYKEKYMDK